MTVSVSAGEPPTVADRGAASVSPIMSSVHGGPAAAAAGASSAGVASVAARAGRGVRRQRGGVRSRRGRRRHQRHADAGQRGRHAGERGLPAGTGVSAAAVVACRGSRPVARPAGPAPPPHNDSSRPSSRARRRQYTRVGRGPTGWSTREPSAAGRPLRARRAPTPGGGTLGSRGPHRPLLATLPDGSAAGEALVDWYATAARDLPWRRPGVAAWAVLVSEIMLQQTPVARVRPVWRAGWRAGRRRPTARPARRRGRPGVGQARLPAPGAAAARGGRRDRRAARRRGAGRAGRAAGAARASARTPPARWPASPTARGSPWSTPTCAGWWPGCGARPGEAGPPPPPGTSPTSTALLPADPARAARFAVAAMELGALVCAAGPPRCAACPVPRACAWRLAGYPPHDGPARRVQRFAGTDRQVRGRLLDVLRARDGPVPAAALDAVWVDAAQRARCLDGLLADGLVEQTADGRFRLPPEPAALRSSGGPRTPGASRRSRGSPRRWKRVPPRRRTRPPRASTAQVGAQHRDLLLVGQLRPRNASVRRPTRSSPVPAARRLRTHWPSPRADTR